VARLASVYPLVTARALARPFTYEVPDGTRVGSVVEVRFGNAKRRGLVVEVGVEPPDGIDVSPVERVVEELPGRLVELALWIADYYGSTPARALALVAPLQRKARGQREQPGVRDSLDGEPAPLRLSASQTDAVERIVRAFDEDNGTSLLLHGATGSGKTEVYLQS
jgi:primosomal protein N' (replication factor Y) (superfamily II helicase)